MSNTSHDVPLSSAGQMRKKVCLLGRFTGIFVISFFTPALATKFFGSNGS
jgi:hypothetical protein